ncbi:MAG TPA: hypothetical protein VIO43_00115 [Lutibacter sp.]
MLLEAETDPYDSSFVIRIRAMVAIKSRRPSVPKMMSALVANCPPEEFANKNAG